MKTLHELADMIKAAATAVDGAATAKRETVEAQKVTANVRAEADQARQAANKDRAEADKYVADQKAYIERVAAEATGKFNVEKAEHERALQLTKDHITRASETLEGVNRQIGEGRAEVEKLNAAKARIRAEIADALKGDGE